MNVCAFHPMCSWLYDCMDEAILFSKWTIVKGVYEHNLATKDSNIVLRKIREMKKKGAHNLILITYNELNLASTIHLIRTEHTHTHMLAMFKREAYNVGNRNRIVSNHILNSINFRSNYHYIHIWGHKTVCAIFITNAERERDWYWDRAGKRERDGDRERQIERETKRRIELRLKAIARLYGISFVEIGIFHSIQM